LQPKKVVVIGITNWKKLPPADAITGDDEKIYRLGDDVDVTCRWTWHPAAGGSWRSIRAAIETAERKTT
jgi:hypothetical protein